MFTIFAHPKPFIGQIGIIQRNAIKSWTLLANKPEIILLGDEKGTQGLAEEFRLRHHSKVEKNEYGVPLVDSLFNIGQELASYPVVCYVHADIIFFNSIVETISLVKENLDRFLISGRRWNIRIEESLDFSLGWEEKLRNRVFSNGNLHGLGANDYFIFTKGLYKNLPPFVLGRAFYDHWLLYKGKKESDGFVDATSSNMVVHQDHCRTHYLNIPDWFAIRESENLVNKRLCIFRSRFYSLLDAEYILAEDKLKKAGLARPLYRFLFKLLRWMRYLLISGILRKVC